MSDAFGGCWAQHCKEWWDVICTMHDYVIITAVFEPHEVKDAQIYDLTVSPVWFTQATTAGCTSFLMGIKLGDSSLLNRLVACSRTRIAIPMPLPRVLFHLPLDVNRIA